MNDTLEFKSLEYLNLDIKKPENYSRCRKTTAENNKLICNFKESYNHKLHSKTNENNFEQLNTIVDLISSFSENVKINLDKLNKTTEYREKPKTSENLIYLKELLEEIFKNTKEESRIQLESIKRIEQEIIKSNKYLETILYGRHRT